MIEKHASPVNVRHTARQFTLLLLPSALTFSPVLQWRVCSPSPSWQRLCVAKAKNVTSFPQVLLTAIYRQLLGMHASQSEGGSAWTRDTGRPYTSLDLLVRAAMHPSHQECASPTTLSGENAARMRCWHSVHILQRSTFVVVKWLRMRSVARATHSCEDRRCIVTTFMASLCAGARSMQLKRSPTAVRRRCRARTPATLPDRPPLSTTPASCWTLLCTASSRWRHCRCV